MRPSGTIYTLLYQRNDYHLFPDFQLETGEPIPQGFILKRDQKNGGLFFWTRESHLCVMYINTNTKVAVVNTRDCEANETLFQLAKDYGAIKVELFDYNFDPVFFLEHGKTRYEVMGFQPEQCYKEDYSRIQEEWETTKCILRNDRELEDILKHNYSFDFRETVWEKSL